MTIGVVGARGFIGSHLLRRLLEREARPIRVMLRNPLPPGAAHDIGTEVIRGDLMSTRDCEDFADGLDVIYYLAHRNTPVNSDRDLPSDALLNVVPLLNLIQAVREGRRRPHLIYFSSGGAIYGSRAGQLPFQETDDCRPASSYGIQKLMAEHYLRLAATQGILRCTVLRIANAYGALLHGQRMQGLIGITIASAVKGEPAKVFGDPDNVRDYVHLDDICSMCERVQDLDGPFSVFNVGTQTGHSVTEVLDIIDECLGRPMTRQFVATVGGWLPRWSVLDISKAHTELGWTPAVTLRDGIRRLVDQALTMEDFGEIRMGAGA